MKLEIRRLSLRLEQFALEVNADLHNARTGVFGPSGSGKTSLLEVIAGLRRPETVRICLDDQLFDDTVRGYSLPVRLKNRLCSSGRFALSTSFRSPKSTLRNRRRVEARHILFRPRYQLFADHLIARSRRPVSFPR